MLLPRPTMLAQMQNAKCKMQNAKCKMQNAECRMQNAKCKMQNARCKGAIRRGRHPWRPARMRCLRKCKMQNAKCRMQNARCKGAIRRGRHPCESCEVMYTDSRVKKCLTLIMPMIIYEKRERKAKGAFVPVSYSRRESKKITF